MYNMYINLLDFDPLAAIDPKNSGVSAISTLYVSKWPFSTILNVFSNHDSTLQNG